jgi:hypothetical protein
LPGETSGYYIVTHGAYAALYYHASATGMGDPGVATADARQAADEATKAKLREINRANAAF